MLMINMIGFALIIAIIWWFKLWPQSEKTDKK